MEKEELHIEHIRVKKGEIPKKMLIAGDPGRIIELSTLLKGPKLLNQHRDFIVYSGKYKDVEIGLASHGIGGPSIAIVVEELHALGAETMIRLGSCGGLQPDIGFGEIIVPTSTSSEPNGILKDYFGEVPIAPAPDFELTGVIISNLKKHGMKYRYGPTFSSDAFHRQQKLVPGLSAAGFVAIEMECSTLFSLAQLRGFKAGATLLVVDNRANKSSFLSPKEINKISLNVGKSVLDALVESQ